LAAKLGTVDPGAVVFRSTETLEVVPSVVEKRDSSS
jgi:hypothetical protein